jgi:hypothetical protein
MRHCRTALGLFGEHAAGSQGSRVAFASERAHDALSLAQTNDASWKGAGMRTVTIGLMMVAGLLCVTGCGRNKTGEADSSPGVVSQRTAVLFEAKDQNVWISNEELSAKYQWNGKQEMWGPPGVGGEYGPHKQFTVEGKPWFGYGNLKIEGSAILSTTGITMKRGSKLLAK